jgi:hypothetical protein
MTEAEWLEATNPFLLLNHIQKTMTERRMRLFSCSCCRTILNMNMDVRISNLLITSERFAEGIATSDDLEIATRASVEFEQENSNEDLPAAYAVIHASTEGYIDAGEVCNRITDAIFAQYEHVDKSSLITARHGVDTHLAEMASIAHDIFGNPFRPVVANPEWLTSTVIALAEGIYEDRAFDRMPILADALQDAGCDNDDILNHCRDAKQVHVRGCWVVDLLLGKS